MRNGKLTRNETVVPVSAVTTPAARGQTTVKVPIDPSGTIQVDQSTATGLDARIGLPASDHHRSAKVASDGTIVYQDGTGAVDIAAQPLRDGSIRVLTVLNGPDAPSEFTYTLVLPRGVLAKLAADGGVDFVRSTSITDAASGPATRQEVMVNRIAPAWALDADGDPVPTRYELRGNNLVQTVDHAGADFNYPITADPWWTTPYRVGKCAASITYVALTTVFVAGKTINIVRSVNAARKWVAAVGGPSNAARLLIGASTKAERARVLAQARNIAGASVLNFFGITQIRANCL